MTDELKPAPGLAPDRCGVLSEGATKQCVLDAGHPEKLHKMGAALAEEWLPEEPKMADTGLLPCATCPWRVDKDATTIPRYSHEKALRLMNTVGEGDAFRRIMACHHSTGNEAPDSQVCRGYLAREGWSNINVRVLLAQGKLPSPTEVQRECKRAGIRLETNYKDALKKMAASIGQEQQNGGMLPAEEQP